ncbi:uncharacterized protein LOC128302254 [Anopheles moucheti]|uniref:uncharacterized protein LOC128302254 n=1 Tax=Anopheles moucheti TaxID=186751 RepID=UPI0022F0B962|nr:uncharacterized protein LOC128302254 [Anopheles moucheti]
MAKVSASTHQDPAILDMMEISKKRPPKLKSADRTVSVRIDNYSPGSGGGGAGGGGSSGGGGGGSREGSGSATGGSSPIMLDSSLILHHSPVERLSPIPMAKHSPDPKIFFRSEASPTSLKVEDPWSIARKQFRRSDTLHVYSPSMHQLRKATSFHSRSNSGGSNPDEIVAAPIIRHSSVRHTHIYPREYLVKQDSGGGVSSGGGEDEDEELTVAAAAAAAAAANYRQHSPNVSANRRNCHMHRSFNDQQKRNQQAFLRRDSVKFHSLGEDMPAEVVDRSPRAEAKKFSSANASLENEIYRSRSNSRTDKKGESFSEFVSRQNSKKYNQKNSTTSLDQALPYVGGSGGGSFRRSLIQHSNAHLLSPNPPFLDDFKPQKSPIFDQKKSYSLRYKNGRQDARENFKAKKSKSFIVDLEPPPPAIISATGSPYRKDSMAFTPEEADKIYKASRKLSSNLMLDDIGRTEISPIPMDIMDINYGVIMKTYQMNRQKSLGASRKGRRKFADKKLAGSSFDDDTESSKKRKRIVCIVMTVFLVLALFSVLAVLVTLTHTSSGSSGTATQTKTQYTFARDTPIHAIPTYMVSKDSPKHYNGGN